MQRRAGEGTVRFTGDRVGVEERCHGEGHTVLHTWLQVRDHDLLFVRHNQSELQHRQTSHKHRRLITLGVM